ncbi:MAG: 2-phosphosulfolactate phosphatase [Solirubrobacteraceae bacterium]|jgi:2-phosphosulfolactate phosphatase
MREAFAIDVALTRAELRPADIAVVIDVLRATSTITDALAGGYQAVLCADSIERAARLRGPGRVLAGERRCVMPDGFDQGNSPQEAAQPRGRELVLATGNGTPTIVAAGAGTPTTLVACLRNLDAVIAALRRAAGELQIVCSGTDGGPALEDMYVAGRICAALSGPRSDAALIAEAVARAYGSPLDALSACADAAVLREVGLQDDIAYCAQQSRTDVVPAVALVANGVATVVDTGTR